MSPWSPEADAQLRDLYMVQFKTAREISVLMGRGLVQVRNRIRHLGLLIRDVMTEEEAKALRLAKAQAVKTANSNERRARVVALAQQGMQHEEIMATVGMSRARVCEFLTDARKSGELEKYRKPKKPPQVEARLSTVPGLNITKATRFLTPEDAEARSRMIAHARRTVALPPLTKGEAARLVAEAVAAGKVTRCPPRAVAAINQGLGLAASLGAGT